MKKKTHQKFIAIGVSTGGPSLIEKIICNLPVDFPLPIIIIQHMPEKFTCLFAERLDKNSLLDVSELRHCSLLEPGMVFIAPGNSDVKICYSGNELAIKSIPVSEQYLWHPSIDRFLLSVRNQCDPKSVICVLLTGMGYDGAKETAALQQLGARTIAESEETAVVYGMPKKLVELNGADCILPSYKIADKLIEWSKN